MPNWSLNFLLVDCAVKDLGRFKQDVRLALSTDFEKGGETCGVVATRCA